MYITFILTSPSGRQFESFKEISTYLISVIGEENLDKQNILHANGSNESTLKEASVSVILCLQLFSTHSV